MSYHFNQVRLGSSKKQDEGTPAAKDSSKKETKNKEALNKLNLLLKQIVEEDVVSSSSKLELAKPKPKRMTLKQKKATEVEKVEKQPVG